MLKPYLSFFLLIAVCLLCACYGKNNAPQPVTMIGTWNLQQQEVKTYYGSQLLSDSVYNASSQLTGTLQFNADSSYISQSDLYGTVLGQKAVVASAKSTGKFGFVHSIFSLSGSLAGFNFSFTSATQGDMPLIQIISQTESIGAVTREGFTITFDTVQQSTLSTGVTTSYHIVTTYQYTK